MATHLEEEHGPAVSDEEPGDAAGVERAVDAVLVLAVHEDCGLRRASRREPPPRQAQPVAAREAHVLVGRLDVRRRLRQRLARDARDPVRVFPGDSQVPQYQHDEQYDRHP